MDWGAARQIGESRDSPWGNLPFVADEVARCFTPIEPGEKPFTWTATPATDLEAVVYLFAAVTLCGQAACAPGWYDPMRVIPRLPPPLPPPPGPIDMVETRAQFLEQHAQQLGAPLFDFLRRVRAGEAPYDFAF